jgi:hypothetical protein
LSKRGRANDKSLFVAGPTLCCETVREAIRFARRTLIPSFSGGQTSTELTKMARPLSDDICRPFTSPSPCPLPHGCLTHFTHWPALTFFLTRADPWARSPRIGRRIPGSSLRPHPGPSPALRRLGCAAERALRRGSDRACGREEGCRRGGACTRRPPLRSHSHSPAPCT